MNVASSGKKVRPGRTLRADPMNVASSGKKVRPGRTLRADPMNVVLSIQGQMVRPGRTLLAGTPEAGHNRVSIKCQKKSAPASARRGRCVS